MTFIKLFILFLAFIPCTVFSNVYDPKNVWPLDKKSIHLCFLNPNIDGVVKSSNAIAPSSELRTFVKDALLHAYGNDGGFLKVEGLDECTKGGNQDAIIAFDKSGESHTDTFSKVSDGLIQAGNLWVRMGIGAKTEGFTEQEASKIKVTVLHEIGHLYGLVHEHSFFIDDIQKDPNCLIKRDGGTSVLDFVMYLVNVVAPRRGASYMDLLNKGYQAYGAYDSKSIMNYCYMNTDPYTYPVPELSEGDIQALRSIYRNHLL